MNGAELVAEFQELTDLMVQTIKKKNADYAGQGGNADAFANFKMIERLSHGAVTTEHGFLTRMTDKLSRVISLTTSGKGPSVKDESLTDTLVDLSAYCLLFVCYLNDKAVDERLAEYEDSGNEVVPQKFMVTP